MLIRTSRICCLHQDRFPHLVWLLLVLLVLQVVLVALEVLQVGLQEVLPLDMALATVMEEVVDLDQDMDLSTLEVGLVTMVRTEDMVDHHLDQVDIVAAMEAVDLVDTMDHPVDSILLLRTATHQAAGIHQDHRTATHQVVLQVDIHLKVLLAAIHHLDLVDHHIQDLEVLLVLDLAAHLVLDLVVHHTLDLVVLPFLDLEVLPDLVLQVKVVHQDPVAHHRQFSLVLLLQVRTLLHPHHQQMVLPHHPPLQAQQTLQHQEPTHWLHQTTHLLLHLPSPGQQVHPPRIPAPQALPLPTIHHLTLPMVDHLLVHTTTHHPLASLTTRATHHTQHQATPLEDPLQDTHPVVPLQVLEAMVVPHRVLVVMVVPQVMVALQVMVVLLGMVVPQDMVLQGKEVTLHMAIRVAQEATLVLLEDTLHHTAHLVVQVAQEVQWALLPQEDILPMTKTAMVLPLLGLEVLHHLKWLQVDPDFS